MLQSPLFVDVVLYVIYALIAVAVLLTAWSAVCSFRRYGSMEEGRQENGVPVRRIALLVGGLLVLTLLVAWFTSDAQPLNINGKAYVDTFWLRISDMLIHTIFVLMAMAVVAIAYSGISQWRNAKDDAFADTGEKRT